MANCKHGFMVDDCNVCARERRDADVRRQALDEVEREFDRVAGEDSSVTFGLAEVAVVIDRLRREGAREQEPLNHAASCGAHDGRRCSCPKANLAKERR